MTFAPHSAKDVFQAVGQADSLPPPFRRRFARYYKILISSRAATISWWDRRFRLSPPAVAGVWLRLMLLLYYSSQLAKNGSYRGVRTLACNVGTHADVVPQAFLPVFRSVDIWWSGDADGQADSLPALVAAMLLGGAGGSPALASIPRKRNAASFGWQRAAKPPYRTSEMVH
jgi:hypothetical protein